MKWVALGAATLALIAGAFALTSRGGGQGAPEIVPTKPSPSVAQPTPVSPCQNGGQDSDPTRDDSSSTRSTKAVCSNGENDNSGDDQAGDDEAGDSRDDQAGDNKSGDGRDEQDGENDKGD